jgi:hypothetical protein
MSSFDPFTPLKRQEPLTMWTIAGGVCIGILAANAIEFAGTYAWARIQLQEAAYEMEKATKQAESQLRQQRADHDAADAERRENLAAQQRAEYQARQAAIDAKAKKDAAWQAFYHRDPKCDNNPIDDATFTKCANDAVKARTTFEATYTP